jgi:hypothetical protein
VEVSREVGRGEIHLLEHAVDHRAEADAPQPSEGVRHGRDQRGSLVHRSGAAPLVDTAETTVVGVDRSRPGDPGAPVGSVRTVGTPGAGTCTADELLAQTRVGPAPPGLRSRSCVRGALEVTDPYPHHPGRQRGVGDDEVDGDAVTMQLPHRPRIGDEVGGRPSGGVAEQTGQCLIPAAVPSRIRRAR